MKSSSREEPAVHCPHDHRSMKHFDTDATRDALAFARLVPALRDAFAGEASVPPRHVHAIEAGADRGTVLIMPAWSDAGFLGIKTINIFPGNGARGLPGLHATYVLYDAHTGVPLAMMDGNEITAQRTAAASALGASFLARRRCAAAAGARHRPRRAPAAGRACDRAADRRSAVWNHRPEGAQALAAQWRSEGWNAQAATDLEAAVRQRRHRELRDARHLAARSRRVAGAGLAPGPDRQLHAADARGRSGLLRRRARPSSTPTKRWPRPAICSMRSRAGALARDGVQATLAELCRGTRRDAAARRAHRLQGRRQRARRPRGGHAGVAGRRQALSRARRSPS